MRDRIYQDEVLAKGMAAKSKEFAEGGSEL